MIFFSMNVGAGNTFCIPLMSSNVPSHFRWRGAMSHSNRRREQGTKCGHTVMPVHGIFSFVSSDSVECTGCWERVHSPASGPGSRSEAWLQPSTLSFQLRSSTTQQHWLSSYSACCGCASFCSFRAILYNFFVQTIFWTIGPQKGLWGAWKTLEKDLFDLCLVFNLD